MEHIQMYKIDELKELAGQDTDYVKEIIDEYLSNGDKRCLLLMEAVKQKDCRKVNEVAHSFKSPSGYLGAQVLSQLLKEAEMLAKEERLGEITDKVEEIEKEYAFVRASLLLIRDEMSEE